MNRKDFPILRGLLDIPIIFLILPIFMVLTGFEFLVSLTMEIKRLIWGETEIEQKARLKRQWRHGIN